MIEILEKFKDLMNPQWEFSQIVEEDCEDCGQDPCECEEEEDGGND